jgi:hypothetical protein
VSTQWRPPADARPRHYAFAMLEAETETEREAILALAPPMWVELISTHYTLFSAKRLRIQESTTP